MLSFLFFLSCSAGVWLDVVRNHQNMVTKVSFHVPFHFRQTSDRNQYRFIRPHSDGALYYAQVGLY